MGRLRQELPYPGGHAAGHGGRYIARRVAQVDGVDFRARIRRGEAGAEGQDAAAVCGRAFGEHADDGAGILFGEVAERDELCAPGRGGLRFREGHADGAPQAEDFDVALAGPAPREHRAEDARQVQWVQRAREAARHNGAFARQAAFALLLG